MMKQVLADVNEKRPIVMCEYAYAKGNSTGNFFKFWDMVDAFPRFQGGCIWDWNDKALLATNDKGQKYWAYGGDFGGDFNYQQAHEDPQMCCNGVVGPDLAPHPGAYEVKKVQAPVGIQAVDVLAGRFHHLEQVSHLEPQPSRYCLGTDGGWPADPNGQFAAAGDCGGSSEANW